VASLQWVSPRATNEGVIPIFFLKKTGDQFSALVTPIYFLLKSDNLFFAHHSHVYWFHSGVTPCRMSPRTFFYLSDLVYPLFLVNLPTQFFSSGVTPWRVSPGAPPSPLLVTPLKTDLKRRLTNLVVDSQRKISMPCKNATKTAVNLHVSYRSVVTGTLLTVIRF